MQIFERPNGSTISRYEITQANKLYLHKGSMGIESKQPIKRRRISD